MNMSALQLTDDGIIAWCRWMGEQLARHKKGYFAKIIDFSRNNIGSAGAGRLCRLLEMHKVSCEVFRLFRNNLDDEAARDVGRYLTSFNRAPVHEMHLSHNKISVQGVKWILACLAMHPAYPRWCEEAGQFVPLWLRLELNSISEDEALHFLRTVNDELMISTCTMRKHQCSPKMCKNPGATCGLKHNCVAHLPWFAGDKKIDKDGDMAPHSRPFFAEPIVKIPHWPRRAVRQEPFVIYEDRDIAVVFKPADWVCNPEGINPRWQTWSSQDRRRKLNELLEQRHPVPFHSWILLHFGKRSSFIPKQAYGLVHRLDKDTSGPLLVGKTIKGWQFCRDQINGRDLLKSYICLVHGELREPEGECHAPINSNQYVKTHTAFIDFEQGQPAISIYEALASYECPRTGDRYTLVHVRIVTGRTHQIRLHMKHMGYPLVGERVYVTDRKIIEMDRQITPTLFLHKCRIGFRTMEYKVRVCSCSLQMSSSLWKGLETLRRLGGASKVGEANLGSCGLPNQRP
jgi:23S rRNA-/tRNA-specific pseudouridylate synthase